MRLGERERKKREETPLKQEKGRRKGDRGNRTMDDGGCSGGRKGTTEGGREGGREEGMKGERGGKSVTFLRASSKRMSRVRVLHPFAKEEE